MKHRSFRILGHGRCVAALSVVATLAAGWSTAYGQLTAEDISALREQGRKEGWTFQVGESSATKLPLKALCGAVEPPDWRTKGPFDVGPKDVGQLPATFDWRAQNGCTPIKEQGCCQCKVDPNAVGACWAFATVGPLECNILIKDGLGVDLSEQWLISCNKSNYSCEYGGWDVHAYHQATAGKCGHSGAVLEATYPYAVADTACSCTNAANHVYHINAWAYIGGGRYTNPPVDMLKRAILDHGPITVCVFAGGQGSPFHAYKGGIFNACSGSSTNHDHMVVLVGWDDNQAGGVWFVRNSWGTDWGENGYMRIKYNCSNIGYAASYINYPGAYDLQVSPSYGFASQGPLGGPFDTTTMTYMLSNHNVDAGLMWQATCTQSWLEFSPSSGAIAPGTSSNVTVTINSNANALGPGLHQDWIKFANIFTHHTNTFPVWLTVQRQPIYDFPLDTKPHWTQEGEWDFGQPTGHGGTNYGFPDPTSGTTGTNVFGVNLNGDYATTNWSSPWYYLTTRPLDFRGYTRTMLQFQRWLNCRSTIGVSQSNVTIDICTNKLAQGPWTQIWCNTNQVFVGILDPAWTKCQYDLPALADNCPNLYVRWGYCVPDSTPCSGWNIDDIAFLGIHVPVITNQPASRTNGAGTTASFAVTAGGLGPLSYHWVKNGTNHLTDGGNISGATTPTLTITNLLGADRGNYSVTITNVADGMVTSSNASLTVIDPLITSQPASSTNLAGTTATFTVSASGTAPLGYQWVKNGTNYLADTNNVSGAMTATLTLTNVAQSDAASYTVIVTNPAGTLTSWPAILTVLVPPAITTQPQSRTNYFGTTATFTVSASGTEPLSYQWRKGGTNLADRTDVILTLTNVGRRDNGVYAVLVTNICNSTPSSNATLLVRVPQRLGTPSVLCGGTCIILSGDADGGLLSTNDLADFDLYASTNLETWILLTNSLSLTNGQLRLCDPGSTNLPIRFYRVIER